MITVVYCSIQLVQLIERILNQHYCLQRIGDTEPVFPCTRTGQEDRSKVPTRMSIVRCIEIYSHLFDEIVVTSQVIYCWSISCFTGSTCWSSCYSPINYSVPYITQCHGPLFLGVIYWTSICHISENL